MADKQPIRVLALMESYSISGVAKALLEFGREAVRRPSNAPVVELSLVTFRRGAEREEPVLAEAIRSLGIEWDVIEERGRYDFSVLRQLKEIMRRRRPEIIWSNNVKSHLLVRMSGFSQRQAWVAFHHGYTTTSTMTRIYNQLDRWSLRKADRVFTVCQPFAVELDTRGVQSGRIRVQHMPIRPWKPVGEAEKEAVRAAWGLVKDESVVLSVGRLSSEKGHADLLHAFAILREASARPVRLLLAGEGPERPRLEALCQELNLTRTVTFVGQQRDVLPYYAIASVFILPSHSEGSPNVLLEAMAAEVPVVATRVGGVPELAEHDRDALLVNRSDWREMADAMGRLLRDQALRMRLVESALGVLASHTPEAYFRNIARVMEEAREGRDGASNGRGQDEPRQ